MARACSAAAMVLLAMCHGFLSVGSPFFSALSTRCSFCWSLFLADFSFSSYCYL